MTELYRVSDDVLIDGAAFVNSFVSIKTCDEPQPKVEMCCDQPGCRVREIVLEVPFVSSLQCPACGQPLRFVSYLQEVRLVASDTPRCESLADAIREIKNGAV